MVGYFSPSLSSTAVRPDQEPLGEMNTFRPTDSLTLWEVYLTQPPQRDLNPPQIRPRKPHQLPPRSQKDKGTSLRIGGDQCGLLSPSRSLQ